MSGSVDLIEDLPTDDLASLKKNPKLTVVDTPSVRLIYAGVNVADDMPPGVSGTQGRNPFKDVRVRRALTKAIDREALVNRVMDGAAVAAADLMMPGVPGTRDDAVVVKYDPEGAKKLLAEAGFPSGFSMTLGTPNGRYVNDLKVAQAIASMWGRIGVKASVEASTPPIFFKNLEARAYSGFMKGWGDTTMSARQLSLLGTPDVAKGTGASNHGGYSDPEVDRLIATAFGTVDDQRRSALLQQASAKAIDTDVAVMPLYFEKTSWGMRKGLTYAARPDQWLLAQFVKPVASK
jgi:peptide/nickel transport system substrate-binding protein